MRLISSQSIKHRYRMEFAASCFAGVSLALTCPVLAEDVEYEYAVIVLDTLGGEESFVQAINDTGVAAGSAYAVGNVAYRAVVYPPNQPPVDLGTLGGTNSFARDINLYNEVVGNSETPNGSSRPFLFRDGQMIELSSGQIVGLEAYAINDISSVTGTAAFPAESARHAFLWEDGDFTDLGALREGERSEAFDINNRNDVVGYSFRSGRKGVLWKRGAMIELPPISDGASTEAFAINNRGFIVGRMTNNWQKSIAAIWSPDLRPLRLQPFGDPPTIKVSIAYAINDNLEVVGRGFGPKDANYHRDTRAFIWNPIDGMRVLDVLLPPHFPYTTLTATDINNHGQIAAMGSHDATEFFRGLVVTPVESEFELEADDGPLTAGEINRLSVTGARPGASVSLVFGREGGGRYIPKCNALDAMSHIADPTPITTKIANADGVVAFQIFIPDRAANKGFLFQAIDFDHCEESALISKRVK